MSVWVHLLLEALDSHMWYHLVGFKTFKKNTGLDSKSPYLDKVQLIAGCVYGAIKVAFDTMRENLYALWSLVFLRRITRMGWIPRTLSDGYAVERALWQSGWASAVALWKPSRVFSWFHLVSMSCGNLVSHEPANEEWQMTNSCWNFFPVFINLCIDVILIQIILTAPVGVAVAIKSLVKNDKQSGITGRKLTLLSNNGTVILIQRFLPLRSSLK